MPTPILQPAAHLLCVAVMMTGISVVSAQHNDIEFSYENGKIAVEFGPEGRVFESEFPTEGSSEQETEDPGIASDVMEGLGINPGDVIDYNILGPLQYYRDTDFAAVPSGAEIIIGDNSSNPNAQLTVTATTSVPISGPGIIGIAKEDGDLHTHLEFTLAPSSLDAPQYGAYGLLLQLTTDEPGIAPSDPFYIVFNFGLPEVDFENAVAAFAAQVPEPSSIILLATATMMLCFSRRKLKT